MTPARIKELRALVEASGGLPWSYRPQPMDDWGYIRTTGNSVAAISRQSMQDERSLDDHRADNTDPYEPYGRLIVAAVNELPALLDEVERLRGALSPLVEEFGGSIEQYHKIGPDFTHKDGTETLHTSVLLDREPLIENARQALEGGQ